MHDERSAGTLTDAALDAEIARALTVDPSLQFVARVRAQIAQESPRRASYRPWLFAAAALVVAAAATVQLVRNTSKVIAPLAPLAARSEVHALSLPDNRSPLRIIEPETIAPIVRRPLPRREPKELEVLIVARDRTALYALVRVVSAARVPPTVVVDAPSLSVPIDTPDTVIRPLVIQPLALAAGEEGARQ
jgi:hypothetical protein